MHDHVAAGTCPILYQEVRVRHNIRLLKFQFILGSVGLPAVCPSSPILPEYRIILT